MRRFVFAVFLALCTIAPSAQGAVIVLANFTPADLTVTITQANTKPQTVTLTPAQVAPIQVIGPAEITFPTTPGPKTTLRLDVYNGYVFLPDKKAGLRLEGIELPDAAPERDARQELNPVAPKPVKVPVTLLVDDVDPRPDALWQKALRSRFDTASAVVEAHSGVQFEFAGFDTWSSDPMARDVGGLLNDFEAKVKVPAGRFAIGYTSRKVDEKPKEPAPFGACRGFPTRHILLREWAPRAELERTEVLIQHMGLALGATLTPDLGSVMREKLADGLALAPQHRYRFDPLNVLAMQLWADELRRGPLVSAADVSPANRVRLTRIYKAQLKARPGDSMALTYLNEFDRDVARAPEPKKGPDVPAPKDPVPQKEPARDKSPREAVARAVIRAVTARGRANVGPDALVGDELTAAYVRIAADAALRVEGLPADSPERVSGFLIGLGVALDDSDALRQDALTEGTVKAVETEADREIRVSVLGNPTILGRRDLSRRFAIGCGAGEMLPSSRAEEVAVNRSLALTTTQRASGVSFPALAAELAGVAFAREANENPDSLLRYRDKMTPAAYLLPPKGLRDALSAERFEEDYGDAEDSRFRAVLNDIRNRLKARRGPMP